MQKSPSIWYEILCQVPRKVLQLFYTKSQTYLNTNNETLIHRSHTKRNTADKSTTHKNWHYQTNFWVHWNKKQF
jgi:hypothetical protein